MTPQNETPTSVATLAGATRFQQSKQILSLALQRMCAIFCMRLLCLGDLLILLGVVLAMLAAGVSK